MWLVDYFQSLLPVQILPGLTLTVWTEVRGPEGALFTVDTLRVVCTWFGG